MIGSMIAKAREDIGMTKTELAKLIGVDISYLTHIEKGNRIPSHKILKNICKALNIPYQPLMYTYDKSIPKNQKGIDPLSHISYNRVLAIDSVSNFIECPASIPSASVAIKMEDTSMLSTFDLNSYAFVDFNTALKSTDVGLFYYNGSIIIRHYLLEKETIILKSDLEEQIKIQNSDEFYIIGKILR